MISVRRANDRFHSQHGWLDSWHTFSFAGHHDPRFSGHRSLLVINDDRVEAARGFGTHGHRDMEIVSYVLEGQLGHRDSMGNGSVIVPGDVQRMTAGTGVMHSEMNPSREEDVHFLQIWIVPERRGIAPSYEQKRFEPADKRDRLRLVASRDGREGSVVVHQDVALYATLLSAGAKVEHGFATGRGGWLHVATGSVRLNGEVLRAGDGAALEDVTKVPLEGVDPESELLLFDMA